MTFSISSSASIARMIGASLMASGRVPNMVMTRSDTDELLGDRNLVDSIMSRLREAAGAVACPEPAPNDGAAVLSGRPYDASRSSGRSSSRRHGRRPAWTDRARAPGTRVGAGAPVAGPPAPPHHRAGGL